MDDATIVALPTGSFFWVPAGSLPLVLSFAPSALSITTWYSKPLVEDLPEDVVAFLVRDTRAVLHEYGALKCMKSVEKDLKCFMEGLGINEEEELPRIVDGNAAASAAKASEDTALETEE